MISEFCPQVYKSVTWNLDETMKWIRCVWIFVIPSMTPLHFLKGPGRGFYSVFISCHLYFMWHDLWLFLFRKCWTVFVYLKEEVVGSTKCLITVAFSSHFWIPLLESVYSLRMSSVVMWKGDGSWWVCFRDLSATCRWGVLSVLEIVLDFDGISNLT